MTVFYDPRRIAIGASSSASVLGASRGPAVAAGSDARSADVSSGAYREVAPPAGAALTDYFRCPAGSLRVCAARELPADEGYFTFGGAVAYGRCSATLPAYLDGGLPEVSDEVEWQDGHLVLPFDLTRAITNLREERYRQAAPHWLERVAASGVLRSAYYAARPLLQVAVRKHLQKLRLSGWARIRFPRWPVDFSVERLMQEVVRCTLERGDTRRLPFIWFWPDGASSCALMTHDVEGPAGAEFCSALMDVDQSFGIPSAFQVIPDSTFVAPELVEAVRARGFELNLHDLNHDCSLFQDRVGFKEKAAEINRYARKFRCAGFRSAAMYREQTWYEAFDFSYDMSVPNVAHLEPQRGGCCTVMPYFVGDILELPLTTIQDYSLLHILGDYSTKLWEQQMESILAQHGLISFIAHPDYLREPRAFAVYRDLLKHICRLRDEKNVWVTTPGEVDRWWRNRQMMSLVPDGESWRVEGPDSERARIAYAVLDEGRVVYQVA